MLQFLAFFSLKTNNNKFIRYQIRLTEIYKAWKVPSAAPFLFNIVPLDVE